MSPLSQIDGCRSVPKQRAYAEARCGKSNQTPNPNALGTPTDSLNRSTNGRPCPRGPNPHQPDSASPRREAVQQAPLSLAAIATSAAPTGCGEVLHCLRFCFRQALLACDFGAGIARHSRIIRSASRRRRVAYAVAETSPAIRARWIEPSPAAAMESWKGYRGLPQKYFSKSSHGLPNGNFWEDWGLDIRSKFLILLVIFGRIEPHASSSHD